MKQMFSYLIFGNGRDISRKAAFWNMTFSLIDAVQSAVMMLVVTRLCGVEVGGVFAIAYTTAQLMYLVGSYSVRNFQATDTQFIYSYQGYAWARTMTCIGMVVASVAFCLLRGYSAEKAGIVLAACLYKLVEVVEDLDHGELQRRGRLDIGGRVGTLRICLNDVAFIMILVVTRNVMAALLGVAMVSLFVTLIAHGCYRGVWGGEGGAAPDRVLLDCFPLFVSGCLAMYINNAVKYAIDAHLGDETQAYFSVIFMPVFTINLLSAVFFRPLMKRTAELWNEGATRDFGRMIWRQALVIFGLSVAITGFGVTIGLRLLGLIYGLELVDLKREFSVLLIGGGLVALHNYLNTCITIMRRQKFLLLLSGSAAVVAFGISNVLVMRSGITGACWAYLILTAVEMLGAVMLTSIFCHQGKRGGRGASPR